MDEKSMWDIYDEIMQDTSKWNYFSDLHPTQSSQDLFSGTNALEYIKSTFTIGGKASVLDIANDERFEMNQYRSNHTLSAYLLGIALQDKMHIDMRELPRISSEPRKNFLYFWSLTCLYHDFAFSLEEATTKYGNEYLTHLKSLSQFEKYFNIKYSLSQYSHDAELIKNYYRYVVERHGHVDHGIAGAFLFCNAMLSEYYRVKKMCGVASKETFEYNGKKYSKDFEKHVVLIANTIAKHNMWKSSEATKEDYILYNLDELISTDDSNSIISLDNSSENDKEKLLFLLGLVDTLEPIKNLGRDQNKRPLQNPYIVLEKIKVNFDYAKGTVTLKCPAQYIDDYYLSIKDIGKWMAVALEYDEERIVIKIFRNNKTGNVAA